MSAEAPPVALPLTVRVATAAGPTQTLELGALAPRDPGRVAFESSGGGFGIRASAGTPVDVDATTRRWDLTLEVVFGGPEPLDAGLVVALRLGAADEPHWLIPGLFYGENRSVDCTRRYPRFSRDPVGDDLASDRWSFRSDRAATPSVTASDGRTGATLAVEETSTLGPTGIGFAALPDATELQVLFPFREEPVVYDGFERPQPPDVRLFRWEPGAAAAVTFRLYLHGPERHAYAPVLRDLHGWLSAEAPLRPWATPADTARLAAYGLVRWHWRPGPDVLIETAAFERAGDGSRAEPTDRQAMHVAWLSGAPAAYALLAHGTRTGDAAAAEVGARVLDAIAGHLAPAGTFWGQWTAANGWTKGWTPGEDRLHARTLGEAATFMARAARRVGDGHPSAARWRDAVASNLRFVAVRQREDGALPAQWNGTTGAVESWTGSAGLAWVPALVEGAQLLGDPSLLSVARRAGEYHARQVEDEFLFGAPEDVDLAPSSEDGYVAVMAYVALADSTPPDDPARDRWIGLARRAADWTLTFRYAYNIAFPATTLLGRYFYRSRGADGASPANQHLHAYGLVCLPEMVRLAELTGDPWYLERTRENLACFRQFVARDDGDFNARRGMTPERFYQTNCFGPKGAIGPLSHAWCLGLILYACDAAADLPGLVPPDEVVDGP